MSTLSVEKVATPATAAAVVVPESLAPLVPVPVVIVSVKSEDADVFEAYQAGADRYLTKPFNPMELLMVVR